MSSTSASSSVSPIIGGEWRYHFDGNGDGGVSGAIATTPPPKLLTTTPSPLAPPQARSAAVAVPFPSPVRGAAMPYLEAHPLLPPGQHVRYYCARMREAHVKVIAELTSAGGDGVVVVDEAPARRAAAAYELWPTAARAAPPPPPPPSPLRQHFPPSNGAAGGGGHRQWGSCATGQYWTPFQWDFRKVEPKMGLYLPAPPPPYSNPYGRHHWHETVSPQTAVFPAAAMAALHHAASYGRGPYCCWPPAVAGFAPPVPPPPPQRPPASRCSGGLVGGGVTPHFGSMEPPFGAGTATSSSYNPPPALPPPVYGNGIAEDRDVSSGGGGDVGGGVAGEGDACGGDTGGGDAGGGDAGGGDVGGGMRLELLYGRLVALSCDQKGSRMVLRLGIVVFACTVGSLQTLPTHHHQLPPMIWKYTRLAHPD